MKRKAFTLLELLVVIAIIVILVTLLYPTFSSAKAHARATMCRNRLHRLGEAFGLSQLARQRKKNTGFIGGQKGNLYPKSMLWPTIPSDTVTELEIYKCPEAEITVSAAGSLADLEYRSPFGKYALNVIGEGTCYKSRRGMSDEGPYTEYIMQDDEGTGGQYAAMDFNGWVDTDGGMRMYDSGVIHVWLNIQTESQAVNSDPNWDGAHGGYPTGINTCGNMNDILYRSEGAFGGAPRLQDQKGKDWQLPDWGTRITNYAISSNAYKYPPGSDRIVLVDYEEDTIVNIDTPGPAEEKLLESARHPGGKVNYLKAGGGVRTATPMAISPQLQTGLWEP